MTQLVLLILALVCFVLAAVGAAVPRIALLPLGLAFYMLSLLPQVRCSPIAGLW